jgi:hypothetical protein
LTISSRNMCREAASSLVFWMDPDRWREICETQPSGDSYKCEACEVFGKGDECWLCGGPVVRGYPSMGSPHRYDPDRPVEGVRI